MALENDTTTEIEKPEKEVDFSGNYIEKFGKQDTRDQFPGAYVNWEKVGNSYIFHSENTSLELTVVTEDILKFRYGNFGYFEDDFSYGLDPDKKFEGVTSKFKETKDHFKVVTKTLKCYIYKDSLKTKICDTKDVILVEDEKGYHWQDEKVFGGNVVITTKKLKKGENFFGLGDKTGNLNLLGSRRELWGTDCYGYGNETDPVYKNIPFYLNLYKDTSYGIFLDNTFRSFFDFGKERKSACSFWAQGGEMRYYFINGPKLVDVCEKYTYLTGKSQMPPKWALGYHQSKWSYYPESTVRNLAKEFRDRKIPCDVIHLDIDYMDGFRCFTWDKKRFPNPKKMIGDLRQQGFKSIVIIDPGIKIDKNYSVYQQGVKNGYFCTRGDGPLLKGSVWPGECHFPDFTNPKAREWWATLYKGLISDGVAGVWNDMNEPAVFEDGSFPFDARHDYDGHPCTHRKVHNVYGSLMAQATCDGQNLYLDNKRAFTITRSAYAGVQRFASVWTGDNMATWEHLKIANIQCQRLSASGVSFVGSDVGGFIGSPDGELYTRWIQMAVFHPFFRTHSSGDHGDKEPWMFEEEYTNIVRKFIEMRYELMPYIYTTFWQYATRGTPMIRSLNLIAQDDPESYFREEEFMLGDNILVIPVSEAGAKNRKVYLPEGDWYCYWTDKKYKGKTEIEVETPLNQIPLFVKAGAVLPFQPKMQYTDEFEFDELTLHIYADDDENTSILYEDAGDGLEYKDGEQSVKKIITIKSLSAYIIRQKMQGNFESVYKKYRTVFHGFDSKPKMLMVDGNDITNQIELLDNTYTISLPKNFKEVLIS
ncbi:glycoside hydrolase family 31 protein [Reichenbachiella sp. MALMAid0571]|uniref:glycoside hydrolase family 31 protein n=1 Tax=Reichenbachiella sp. MALMAid0571 TaxID=3143939 RepID=UPI0032DE52C4